MQDDITRSQLVEASFAFVLPLLFQLLYAWWEPIQSFFYWVTRGDQIPSWQPDWPQFLCCLVSAFLGVLFAALFAAARGGYLSNTDSSHLAYVFFLSWKGVSLLSIDIFEVFREASCLRMLLTHYSLSR
jgi:hypothetical protein